MDDPEFRAKTEAVYGDILSLGSETVASGANYYQTNNPALVSADRRTASMPLVLTGSLAEAEGNVNTVLDVVKEADAGEGFRVLMVEDASISNENNELAEKDLRRRERIGIPVALIILIVLIGTITAAFMPVGLSLMSIIVATGITALIGQAMDLVFFVTLMIIMIGLAVGIDHSLVIVSRYRDELARGLDTNEAVERAGATAGRTVLFSGLTVVIALCGILIVPFSFFQSLGLGAVLVVLVALAATLTLLPANLAVLGPRINHLPVPFFGKARTRPSEPSGRGFWELITRTVTRFPVMSIIVVGAPMIAATVFYF